VLLILVFLCLYVLNFRVVMSVTIFALKRCSVRLYLQLFVGGRMSSLRWLCLFAYSGVNHILHCFVLRRLVCPMLPVSLDCPFFIVPSIFSNVYSIQKSIPEWQQKADYIASLSHISVSRIRERGSKYHSRCNKPQLVQNDGTSFKSGPRVGGWYC
jgi:hypothetical protein